jgi:hypothetical protein
MSQTCLRFSVHCYHQNLPRTVLSACILALTLSLSAHAQSKDAKPATAVEAAKVLDLSQFELVDPVDTPNSQIIAKQSYEAKGKLTDVAKRLMVNFKKSGCKELDGTSVTDAYASAMFQKQGFTFSLMLSEGSKPGTTSVNISNLGNVDLKSIPVPKGATQLYAFPATIAYMSPSSVEEVNKECRKLLLAKGWEPFGETTASFFVKQNAVLLQVSVSEAPAQGNKTSIQFTTEQLSADLPAPPYNGFLQYSDSTGGMLFDSDKSQEELVKYFKETLGKSKWTATTDNPVKIDFRDHLIFRNPAREFIELQFYEVEGKTRVDLSYQTAKQFAEAEKKVDKIVADKKKKAEAEMERKKNPPKIEITLPKNAEITEQDDKSLELSTESGAAKKSVTEWLALQEKDGWKLEKTVDTKEIGEYKLTKDDKEIDVSFVDPGFIPGSITIRVSGDFKIDVKKPK